MTQAKYYDTATSTWLPIGFGPQGYQGATGSQGATGTQGTTGTNGTNGSQGATGAQGSTGAQGTTGSTGATGPTGPQGVAGTSLSTAADMGISKGAAGTGSGGALPNPSSSSRVGAVDMIIGDSTSRGDGGTFGSTDWGTVLARTENLRIGIQESGPGMVLPQSTIDSYPAAYGWTGLTSGALVASFYVASIEDTRGGPGPQPTSWKLTGSGQSISDSRSFRRVRIYYQTVPNGDSVSFAVTGGSNPTSGTLDTNRQVASVSLTNTSTSITVTSGGFPNVQLGDVVSVISTTSGTPSLRNLTTNLPTVTQINGNTIVLSSAATGTGVATLGFSGYRYWDSGDLASVAGTNITVTQGSSPVTGSGGSGVYIVGARYYQTDGTKGVVIDNMGIGGTTASYWSATTAGYTGYAWGWTEWLKYHANIGQPIRRLFVMAGINDVVADITATGYATYKTSLSNICDAATAASPTTEVVIIGQWYGSETTTYSGVNETAGSNIIYSTNGSAFPAVGRTLGGYGLYVGTTVVSTAGSATPISASCTTSSTTLTGSGFTAAYTGSVVTGPGITALTTVTYVNATTLTLSTAVTTNQTTPATFTFYGATTITSGFGPPATNLTGISIVVSNTRGGAVNWKSWLKTAEQVAFAKRATFINLFDRFGDISIQGKNLKTLMTAGSCVITGDSSVSPGIWPFPNAAAGQSIYGPNIPKGTTIVSYTPGLTSLTMSAPATATVTAGNGVTVFYGTDYYGLSQTYVEGLHIGDASQSKSGLDGQEAIAAAIMGDLASKSGTAYISGSNTSPQAGDQTLLLNGSYTQSIASSTTAYTQISLDSDVNLYATFTTTITSVTFTFRICATLDASGNPINPITLTNASAANVNREYTFRIPRGWYVNANYGSSTVTFTAIPC